MGLFVVFWFMLVVTGVGGSGGGQSGCESGAVEAQPETFLCEFW